LFVLCPAKNNEPLNAIGWVVVLSYFNRAMLLLTLHIFVFSELCHNLHVNMRIRQKTSASFGVITVANGTSNEMIFYTRKRWRSDSDQQT